MDTEADFQFRPRTGKAASAPLLPEVEAYLQLLVVIFLMNSKRYKEVLVSEGVSHVTRQCQGSAEEIASSGKRERVPGLSAIPQALPRGDAPNPTVRETPQLLLGHQPEG